MQEGDKTEAEVSFGLNIVQTFFPGSSYSVSGQAFRSGNKEELKIVQKELRKKSREEKNSNRRKMEDWLQQSNVSGVYKTLKTMSGQRKPQLLGTTRK